MTSGRLALAAPAKINLTLAVLGQRDDGFHELATVMHTVDLCDDITLSLRKRGADDTRGVTLDVSGPYAETCGALEENLTVRAAEALLLHVGRAGDVGLHIALDKHIPAGAGLGGGSSDAATVLVGLNRLIDEPCPPGVLAELAATLGSDVPFFLDGGCALCTGRGETVRAIEGPQAFELTLLMPDQPLSTAAVYAALPATSGVDRSKADTQDWVTRIAGADIATLESLFTNDLQAAATSLQSRLGEWIEQHHLHLSGSGSTLFAFGDRRADLERACSSSLICSVRSTSGKHCR